MSVTEVGKRAKAAANELRISDAGMRISALKKIASNLKNMRSDILAANKKDVAKAAADGLSDAMIDRLALTEISIDQMAKAVVDIADSPEVAGKYISEFKRQDGLVIKKQKIPLGVLAMIFESRPNVVIDCSAIAIKSANAIILKGGKEAYHSNKILGEIVRESIADYLPRDCVQVLDSFDRETVEQLLTMNRYVDVIIPRGGEKLIEHVYKNATVPVIAHFKGLCHIYIHNDANLKHAIDICVNAKTQRPGVCNAMETLLLNEKLHTDFLEKLLLTLQNKDIELRVDDKLHNFFPTLKRATLEDWDTEYLDRILSVKLVSSEDEAIRHIQKHGTHHTEGIVAKSQTVIDKFLAAVDASCITVNSSTRFNDGGQLGLGAELGISTSKIHAYGPMGVNELMATRYVVQGDGHIRS